ncbi:hypothetical protein [Holophaga foetida]|uniref:hypothetical protein n=1 Tax=Holophaga foetida TaxID=35839 RepID=UPI0002475351|nr:hypothetical protein [Holophaga foetida]
MADASWDNGGVVPKPKGWSTWTKVGLGCGIVVLLFFATCVGGGFLMFKAGGRAMDKAWVQMRKSAEMARTKEGARALYEANPGLSQRYPTVEDFLKASEAWRPRLGEIPVERPDLKTLMDPKKGGGLKIESQSEAHSGKRVRIAYRFSSGGSLVLEMEDKSLTDIRVE